MIKYPIDCRVSGGNLKLYQTWASMLDRVTPGYENAHRYIQRGITVCDEWKYWPNFCRWAKSNGWKPGLEIDREDNNGGYGPGNCRFVDQFTQCRNRDKENLVSSMTKAVMHLHAKPFVCVESGLIFMTQNEAAKATGIERKSIARCLSGLFKQAGGYTWKYLTETFNRRTCANSAW